MDDLLDRAPCSFLRLADDGTILLTNATLRSLLGYDRNLLEDHHVDTILTPGARIFYQTHVFPLLRMHGKVDEVYLSLRSASGADVPVLLNAVRHEREDGGVSDWIVIVIRRRSRFEDELLQAKKAAEEATRAKGRFLSMMSHDLRAPLSGISMAAGILSSGVAGPVTDRQRRELQRIKDASQYVLRLVKDLLNYARLQSGHAEVRMEPISLEDVLARSTSMVQHLVEEAELSLDIEGAPFGVMVLADPDRLQQIVLNLLTNAVKYTGRGGQITLASERLPDRILLHIRDTGRGIPADRLDYIFDPFIQLDRSTGAGSGDVGLGLAISRELARMMGGDITVTSSVGQGSTFTVSLAVAELSNEA